MTGLDTTKLITPDNSSNAIFINAISDQNEISIETDGIKLNSKSTFNSTIAEYQKVQIGVSYLRFISEDAKSVIYHSPSEFIKDKKYTVFAFGSSFSINTLIIEDTIQLNSTLSNFRIINLLKNSGELDFVISDNESSNNYVVSYKSFTGFKNLKSGLYKLTILNSIKESIYEKENIQLNQNSAYNFTLSSKNLSGDQKIVCNISKILK